MRKNPVGKRKRPRANDRAFPLSFTRGRLSLSGLASDQTQLILCPSLEDQVVAQAHPEFPLEFLGRFAEDTHDNLVDFDETFMPFDPLAPERDPLFGEFAGVLVGCQQLCFPRVGIENFCGELLRLVHLCSSTVLARCVHRYLTSAV